MMDFSLQLFHISIESDLVIHQDQGEELGKDEEPGELGDTSNSYLTDQQHFPRLLMFLLYMETMPGKIR